MYNDNDSNNYKYYKITDKSGCVSAKYNIKGGCEQKLVIIEEIDEISGDNFKTNRYSNRNLNNL